MDNFFSDKTLLITGSSRGIGSATAKLALSYGATVIFHGRTDSKELRTVAGENNMPYIACDVTDASAVTKAVSEVLGKVKRIDALVNCAGMYYGKPFLEASDENWLHNFQVNVLGTVHMCQAVIPHMQTAGGGRIVNIASIRGHATTSSNRGMAYSVSKASIITLTATLAKEYAPTIAVNAVSPGFINTDMTKMWNDKVWQQAKSSLLGRVAEPAEVAEAILFLASSRASFMTGQTLLVDGGYTISGK